MECEEASGEDGAREVEAVLTGLAVERGVSAATQNQALNALVFLYTAVLKIEMEGIAALRAKRSECLPVVLTKEEVGIQWWFRQRRRR